MSNDTPGHDLTSEELERDEAEWHDWAEGLGLRRPLKFRDENRAPALDEGLLRTLVRRGLPEYKARAVLFLVVSYRSWYDAYTRVMLDEYHESNPQSE